MTMMILVDDFGSGFVSGNDGEANGSSDVDSGGDYVSHDDKGVEAIIRI